MSCVLASSTRVERFWTCGPSSCYSIHSVAIAAPALLHFLVRLFAFANGGVSALVGGIAGDSASGSLKKDNDDDVVLLMMETII